MSGVSNVTIAGTEMGNPDQVVRMAEEAEKTARGALSQLAKDINANKQVPGSSKSEHAAKKTDSKKLMHSWPGMARSAGKERGASQSIFLNKKAAKAPRVNVSDVEAIARAGGAVGRRLKYNLYAASHARDNRQVSEMVIGVAEGHVGMLNTVKSAGNSSLVMEVAERKSALTENTVRQVLESKPPAHLKRPRVSGMHCN